MAAAFATAFVANEALSFFKDTLNAARESEVAWSAVNTTLDTLGIADTQKALEKAAQTATDLGFSDEGFALHPLEYREHIVYAGHDPQTTGKLFADGVMSATDLYRSLKRTSAERAARVAELVRAIS